ncbi:MAG: hypothetical protein IJU57_02105 [Clostridia bacterium]|nr:hypothetical protein [Clostridia bacterium]
MKALKIKSISLILAGLMLIPLLASCNNGGGPADTSDTISIDVTDADPATTAAVKKTYGMYNYDGYSFRILGFDQGCGGANLINEDTGSEIWYEEMGSDNYQSAVYKRNKLTEELLNISIQPIWGGQNVYDLIALARRLVDNQENAYDMVVANIDRCMRAAMDGYFYNYYDIDTFDLKADWWDQKLVNAYSYANNKLYTIVGHYNVFDDYAMPVVFYNQAVVEESHLTDPADYVRDGTWTIDRMMEDAAKITKEITGDGIMTVDDSWGFLDNGYVMIHFIEGCDTLIAGPNADGIPEIKINSEHYVNAAEHVYNSIACSPSYLSTDNDNGIEIFSNDRALFYYEMLGCINQLRTMESTFSLLPLPKENEDQKNYTSTVNTVWSTALSVPITNTDVDRTGIIMNVLGGFSTDTVHTTLYEVLLGARLIRQPDTVEMLRYVLDSKQYDWSKEFGWANQFTNALASMTKDTSFTLASSLRSNLRVLEKSLKMYTQKISD